MVVPMPHPYTACIGIRRKTNVKNKSWADSEPVLLRYFVGLRKRLQIENEDEPLEGDEYDGEELEPDDDNPEQVDDPDMQGGGVLEDEDDPDEDDQLITIEQALPNGCVHLIV